MSDLSGDFNDDGNQFNKGVPESASYGEYHYTAETHSAPETTSYSETGDAFARTKPIKTLATSRGMNEALKYSSQVATVVKAVTVITVAAVVVGVPLLDIGTTMEFEWFDLKAEDTLVHYYVEVADYNEDMNLTITVHNYFFSRTMEFDGSYASGTVTGLQPNMQYKATIKNGSTTVGEKSFWTTNSSGPDPTGDFTITDHHFDEKTQDYVFTMKVNDQRTDWKDFHASLSPQGNGSAWTAVTIDITDLEAEQRIHVDLPNEAQVQPTVGGISATTVYSCDFNADFKVWCTQTSDEGDTEITQFEEKGLTIHSVPYTDVSGFTFNPSNNTISFGMAVGDPNDDLEMVKVLVECENIRTIGESYTKDTTSVSLDVSEMRGYEGVKVSIYGMFRNGSDSKLMYKQEGISLYTGDSRIAMVNTGGIHFTGGDPQRIYLVSDGSYSGLDYYDPDHVYSNITADVFIVSQSTYYYCTGASVLGLSTGSPYVLLDSTISNPNESFNVTVHYTERYTDGTTEQKDLYLTGQVLAYTQPTATLSDMDYDSSNGDLGFNIVLVDPDSVITECSLSGSYTSYSIETGGGSSSDTIASQPIPSSGPVTISVSGALTPSDNTDFDLTVSGSSIFGGTMQLWSGKLPAVKITTDSMTLDGNSSLTFDVELLGNIAQRSGCSGITSGHYTVWIETAGGTAYTDFTQTGSCTVENIPDDGDPQSGFMSATITVSYGDANNSVTLLSESVYINKEP